MLAQTNKHAHAHPQLLRFHAVVDKALRWRSVLLCIAGHLAGLAVTVKPHKAAVPFELLLSQWHGLREEPDEAEGVDSDLRLADANVARLLSTHAVNPGKAQAILSNLLRPKLPLRLGLLDDSTGLSLSDSAVVQLLTDEVRTRPEQACDGDEAFNDAVDSQVRNERTMACAEAAADPLEFFTFVEVSEWIKAIVPNKASVRFPRAAIVASNHEGRRLCYLLLNLFLIAILGRGRPANAKELASANFCVES